MENTNTLTIIGFDAPVYNAVYLKDASFRYLAGKLQDVRAAIENVSAHIADRKKKLSCACAKYNYMCACARANLPSAGTKEEREELKNTIKHLKDNHFAAACILTKYQKQHNEIYANLKHIVHDFLDKNKPSSAETAQPKTHIFKLDRAHAFKLLKTLTDTLQDPNVKIVDINIEEQP